MPGKGLGYLPWIEYFMEEAELAAKRSKDPRTQVGSCIVGEDNIILSKGYNGLTRGMDDDEFDWTSSGEETGNIFMIKNHYVVHAELNAILNYSGDTRALRGSTIYVTLFPCSECTKAIIQSGIKKVIYKKKYSNVINVMISRYMMSKAGVESISYKSLLEQRKLEELLKQSEENENALEKSKLNEPKKMIYRK